MNKNLINIGDIVIAENFLGVTKYTITRVTKCFAFSKRESDGYEYKFNRDIRKGVKYPYNRFSQTNYKVRRKR